MVKNTGRSLEGYMKKVRMVEDDLTYSTFLEVYENHCSRNNKEADQPIAYFKEQLNQAISGQISPQAVVDLCLQAYNYITKDYVFDNIFSQYMYKTLLSGNHMWAFKKQFAIQLALSSFTSSMLQIGGRSPNKILFAKNTGKIFQTDFHPAYDANGMIEFNEPVPFRLTRNLVAFFSHFGVEGLIVSAMCAAAQAVVSPKIPDASKKPPQLHSATKKPLLHPNSPCNFIQPTKSPYCIQTAPARIQTAPAPSKQPLQHPNSPCSTQTAPAASKQPLLHPNSPCSTQTAPAAPKQPLQTSKQPLQKD